MKIFKLMCPLTFMLCSMTLLLRHMAGGASTVPTRTQKYQILDPAGLESSFLLEGGALIITCNSTDANEELQLMDKSDAKKPILEGKGEISHKFQLKTDLIGKSYECYPSFKGGYFEITKFVCDPFSITPMTTECKDPQVCMMSKDGSASCAELTDENCFCGVSLQHMKKYFMSSLPEMKYACADDEPNVDKKSHGLCYAKAMNVKHIHATTNDPGVCRFFQSAHLNGIKAGQGDFLTESKDVSSWNIEFIGSGYPDNFTCKLYDKTNSIVAEYGASNGQRIAVYKAKSKSKNIVVPDKLKMMCQTSDPGGSTEAIYFYAFLYDVDMFANTTSLTATIKDPGESMTIVCQCSVPPGYFCSISWTGIASPPEISKTGSIAKLLLLKEHFQAPVIHSCFSAVFVVGHPSTYDMVELSQARKTIKQTISGKDFKKSKGEVISPNVDKNETGIVESQNVKNSGDKSDSSSLHPGVIALIVIIVLLATIGLIGFVFWKRSKHGHVKDAASKIKQDKSGGDVHVKTKDARKRSSAASSKSSRFKQETTSKIKQGKPGGDVHVKTKETTKRSSAVSSKYGRFMQEMLDDKEHLLSSGDLTIFFEEMEPTIVSGKTLDAREGCLRHLKNVTPFFSPILEQIDELRAITAPGKYLLSCRKTRHALNPETFVGAKIGLCSEAGERTSIVEVKSLHMNFSTNNDDIRSFILSQAPTTSEIEKFLKLICENKVVLIVSLTSPTELKDEDNVVRDHFPYYNLKKGEFKFWGNFRISCTACILSPTMETRQILVHNTVTSASFTVTILSSNNMHKEITPTSAAQLVHLCQHIDRHRREAAYAGITLVHCTNGLGMSCVVVATLNCMDFLKKTGLQTVNIYRIVEKLRKERIGAIETSDQLCLVYWAVGEFLKRAFLDAAAITKAQKGTVNKTEMKSKMK